MSKCCYFFLDIDECAAGLAVCPRFQKCINTFGSYVCKCYEGFILQSISGKYQCTGKWLQTYQCQDPDSKKLLAFCLPVLWDAAILPYLVFFKCFVMYLGNAIACMMEKWQPASGPAQNQLAKTPGLRPLAIGDMLVHLPNYCLIIAIQHCKVHLIHAA